MNGSEDPTALGTRRYFGVEVTLNPRPCAVIGGKGWSLGYSEKHVGRNYWLLLRNSNSTTIIWVYSCKIGVSLL